MPGLTSTRAALPHPARLALRIALAATLVLWLGYVYAAVLVDALLPWLRSAFGWFGSQFVLLRMHVEQQAGFGRLVLDADLAHPVIIGGHTLQPLRWSSQGGGWSQIELTLGSVLAGPLLLLIVVFAWPARPLEQLLRLVISVPVAALLLLTTTLTQIAELWFPIQRELEPGHLWPLLLASRLLMSGGGLIVAALLGLGVVALAQRAAATRLPRN